jgi:hypothetical protein
MRSLWEKPELCDGSDAVGQLTNGLAEPPHRPIAARAVARLQQLPQVQRQTRFLWETPEVTRAAMRWVS